MYTKMFTFTTTLAKRTYFFLINWLVKAQKGSFDYSFVFYFV